MIFYTVSSNQLFKIVFLLLALLTVGIYGQNSCIASSANDKIFIGSSNLAAGVLKPGVNTFATASGVIQSLSPSSRYDSNKLQYAHSFRNFKSSSPNNGYEMNDFSFHSILVNENELKFMFIWNELSNINITISLSIQFILIYDREQFLLGHFVIDPVQFLLNNYNKTSIQYREQLKFKDLNSLSVIPNGFSQIMAEIFIVGIRYLGRNINIKLTNQKYLTDSTQLVFNIQRNVNITGLYLLHLSYVLFDKTVLNQQYKMFFSFQQLSNQNKIDFWIKGLKQINFQQFQTGNVLFSQFYFFKINRLQLNNGGSNFSCVTHQFCINIKGNIVNDSQCIVCNNGLQFNSQTLKCQFQSNCQNNQVWNGTQCLCKLGFFRINSQCLTCPQNTTYNTTTQSCNPRCDQNSTLTTNNQCICKSGFYIIDGKCSKCTLPSYYDSVSKRCLLTCSVVQVYNSTTQTCQCISGFYRINGTCGKCSNGFTYDSVTKSCLYNCGINQVFLNGRCQCSDGFVIISGSCSKCPTGTIYNSLLQYCIPTCTGNRKILNGKCVCNDGTYEIGNDCGICPTGTIYNAVSKICTFTNNCKQNEVLVNNTCYCYGPYINGVCSPCTNTLIWNSTLQQCILKCPANSAYNTTYKACVCNSGYYVIGSSCDVCPSGTVYDFSSRSCQKGQACPGVNEVFFMGICICDAGYFRIKNNCSTCPSGTVYNETIFDCQAVCSQNQIYNIVTNKCQCNQSGGYYRINGLCQVCSYGTTYNTSSLKCQNICPSGQLFTNGKCTCPTGYYMIGSNCGLCDIGTIYNQATLKCDKACPDSNGYYQNGRCFCYPPYVVVNITLCRQCPINSTYDLSTLSCKSSTTPSNNQNITCNSTSQIKKYNQTSGQYYCACDESQKYYFIYDRCGTCQIFTKYNPNTQSCQLDINYLGSNNVFYGASPISVGQNNIQKLVTGGSVGLSNINCLANDNKVIINGQCKCIKTAIQIGSFCFICPNNSIPNSKQTSCECMSGFTLSLSDYTCKKFVSNRSSSSGIKNSDMTCPQNQIWNLTQCVCVSQFYRINSTCMKCPSFSLFNGSTCNCQFGYYPQSLNQLRLPTNCLKCHSTCSTCNGPNVNQCLGCANISNILTNGQCIQSTCAIGFYYQTYPNGGQCQKCSAYCKSCTSSIQCTQCIDGFNIYINKLTSSLSVKVCSQICGDGKRFQRNCDDGNKLTSDGCNQNCQVENGWACVGGTPTSPDKCSQITPAAKSIITVMNATIQKGMITQNIRLTFIPEYFLKTECSLCSNIFKVTITDARIIPVKMTISYIPRSKFQFSIQFKFNDILAIPTFKFGIQLNPEYKQYFTEWDMGQWYQVEINSVLLSKKNENSYLRVDEIQQK